MNKKLVTGAVIALAAGLAAFIFNKKRRKLRAVASDAYNTTTTSGNGMNYMDSKTENAFS